MRRGWRAGLRSLGLGVLLSLVTLLAVNAVALLILRSLSGPSSGGESFVDAASPQGLQIRRGIFPGLEDEALQSLVQDSPPLRAHPTLAYTMGFSRGPYRIGIESMRYQPGWGDSQVETWLSQEAGSGFVFGGSTVFGHGVPGDQTVVSHLNRLSKSKTRYLNFGVHAYDSIREVDKLVHLLRKGYRPSRVLFIDGLNDVSTFAWSTYPALEKPRTQGLLIDRGEVGLIFGYPRPGSMLSAFAFSFPVVHLAHLLLDRLRPDPSPLQARAADRDPLDWRELMVLYRDWDRLQLDRREELAQEIVAHYRKNLRFLHNLAAAFDFEVKVVYQPIGLLAHHQPFLRPAFQESPTRQIFATVHHQVRTAIQEGRLDMIDCSDSLDDLPQAYVDPAHYSPQGNALLAGCVLEHLDDSW